MCTCVQVKSVSTVVCIQCTKAVTVGNRESLDIDSYIPDMDITTYELVLLCPSLSLSLFHTHTLQVFEDLGSYLRSLHRLNSLSPSLLYPGHGPVIRDTAKIQQYIDHRMAREKQVQHACMHHVDNETRLD